MDLEDYDGQVIDYTFELEDIAGNIGVQRRPVSLEVDTTFPVLNNPESFWEQGEGEASSAAEERQGVASRRGVRQRKKGGEAGWEMGKS